MRTSTFLGICSLLAGACVFALQYIFFLLNLKLPYVDWIVFKTVEFIVFVPLIVFLLNPFHQRFRLWRKQRGRDIEAEERFETETGFISLIEKEKR